MTSATSPARYLRPNPCAVTYVTEVLGITVLFFLQQEFRIRFFFPTKFQPHFFRPEDFRSTYPRKDQRASTVGILAGTQSVARLKTYRISTFFLCLVKISFITPTPLPVFNHCCDMMYYIFDVCNLLMSNFRVFILSPTPIQTVSTGSGTLLQEMFIFLETLAL
jgi:hypothetical protein